MSINSGAVQEGYIQVTGGRVWYRKAGADKKGIPLLVLHGGPGAAHDYLEPVEPLSDERPVIFYDQLGCGYSDRPDNTSLWIIERFVEEIVLIRNALALEKAHILGQSWGSMLAVDYMLTREPEGITSLILSGPCISASRFAADQRTYLLEFPEDIQKTILKSEASGNFDSPEYQDAIMAYYERHVCCLDSRPDCLNRTIEKMGHAVYEYMWGPSEFTMSGTLKDYERAERLKEITVPVLFTCGQYDEATPAATMYYQSMLPGSEIVVFENASHNHHIEKPEEYLAAVRNFLGGVEKRSQ
ncbi:MAG: proline iminopeptidase-family hydrolase [Proteobacteria bacterium]|nr:proline iminopeptidase-family hydrolase [Pseudomonadota bacterium]